MKDTDIELLRERWKGNDAMVSYLDGVGTRLSELKMWDDYRKLEPSALIRQSLMEAEEQITTLLGNDPTLSELERAKLFDRKATVRFILGLFGDEEQDKEEAEALEAEIDGEMDRTEEEDGAPLQEKEK
jgi:hypothetical protein